MVKFAWILNSWDERPLDKKGRRYDKYKLVCISTKDGLVECWNSDCGKCFWHEIHYSLDPNKSAVDRTEEQQGGSWFITTDNQTKDGRRGRSPASPTSRTSDHHGSHAHLRSLSPFMRARHDWDIADLPDRPRSRPGSSISHISSKLDKSSDAHLSSAARSSRRMRSLSPATKRPTHERETSLLRLSFDLGSTLPKLPEKPNTTQAHKERARKLKRELEDKPLIEKKEALAELASQVTDKIANICTELKVLADANGGKLVVSGKQHHFDDSTLLLLLDIGRAVSAEDDYEFRRSPGW